MEIFESKIRQVGTSLGLLIPKDVAVADKLKRNQVVKVAILRKNDALIEKAFGLVKSKPFVRDHNDRVI